MLWFWAYRCRCLVCYTWHVHSVFFSLWLGIYSMMWDLLFEKCQWFCLPLAAGCLMCPGCDPCFGPCSVQLCTCTSPVPKQSGAHTQELWGIEGYWRSSVNQLSHQWVKALAALHGSVRHSLLTDEVKSQYKQLVRLILARNHFNQRKEAIFWSC